MSIYEKANLNAISAAKNIVEAIDAYNHNCEQCLRHGCDGEFCAATRAMKQMTKKREFQAEMQNPKIRQQVTLALEMG